MILQGLKCEVSWFLWVMLLCSAWQIAAQVSFANFLPFRNPARDNASGPDAQGTGPYPRAEERTHFLTTLHLGLDLIPHVPRTGPNPHYLAQSTRTRRLTTTIPFGLRLGQSSTAAASLFRACVRVCVCVNAWTWRPIA